MFPISFDRGAVRSIGLLLWIAIALPMTPWGRALEAQGTPPWAEAMYAMIRSDLNRMAVMQKDHFRVHEAFSTDLGELGCPTSPGVTLRVVVSPDGYSAVGTHESLGTDYGCALYVGEIMPPASPLTPPGPGELTCTRGAPREPLDGDGSDPLTNPMFLPHDTPPVLRNSDDVTRILERVYPSSLRERWIGGTVTVALYVCDQGKVRATVLTGTSGHHALDEAALTVARSMEFEAARYEGEPVGVWVNIPITFTAR